MAPDAALVIGELVTNALLHGGGCRTLEVTAIDHGLRIAVHDCNRIPPVMGRHSDTALTGRGLRLVAALSRAWGVDPDGDGKIVWAELTDDQEFVEPDIDADTVLAMWADEDWDLGGTETRHQVVLGDVPTDLLLAAKSHVDSVVREFTLAAAGARAGLTSQIPPHLASVLGAVVERFGEARVSIKHQALQAARHELPRTRLVLDLPASAADAAEEYLQALDEVDAYCRAKRLLTLETPPQHRVFRRWYISELVAQLRAASAGTPAPQTQTFDECLLAELDRLAVAQRVSARAARLYSLATALAQAATPDAVAAAVLNEGVAALGASGGGVLLSTDHEGLALEGAVGYDEAVVAHLRAESRHADLPAAVALRTGESVWLESQAERDRRFPALVGMEATTTSLCAVPLEVPGRRLGALRFSFTEARLFDEDERRFVTALAGQTAQAMDRAQLQRTRIDVSRRLQRTLLPPKLPDVPGLEIAAIYHPFGDGIDVGGDFYDVWPIGEAQWGIAVGDATGTGPEAAGLTALARFTLRALTMTHDDPQRVLRDLNTALLAAASDDVDQRFCTVIFGVLTAGPQPQIEFAGGGHPPVMIHRADGSIETITVGGALLGVFTDSEVGHVRVQLDAGDTLVLYTDGVTEARNDREMFEAVGVERVLSANTGSARAVVDALEAAVLQHAGGSLNDDVAAIAVHVPAS